MMIDETVLTSRPIAWQVAEEISVPEKIHDWLMELGSMTRRFEQYCQQVTVEPYQEKFITAAELNPGEADCLSISQRYWLREVILYGDNIPWLLGRTLVPEETLVGDEQRLVDLGTVPLGKYLFSGNNLTRDYIHIGKQCDRWARRSLLRLSNKPLLLTELFLPESPAYK
ncbi:chorismate lyase [Moellerella wisconsensis]|uniref:Chorismate lyase n=1 Tax=Moellerella wisconsensis TaxID=158849 RepID=A0ACD3Y6I1_9GAMM|nr:chorismate lyase [Moellerella wisconsensis]UNH38626.1 chorismate lyase [Moellerella wisconsensis]